MARNSKNPKVATIETARLVELLGPVLDVKKSERGATYPLYLSSRMGPIHLNKQFAQDFVLEHGDFLGASQAAEANQEEIDVPSEPPSGGKPAEAPPTEPETTKPWWDRGLEL